MRSIALELAIKFLLLKIHLLHLIKLVVVLNLLVHESLILLMD